MKRCQRCIMPETVPGVTFNRDGICDYCLNYQKERYFGKEGLEKIIASIIKEENEYDCIVPLSGGRDSTYILYMAKAIYNLKVLAVSYDNEFRIDQALINMKNACQRLNVDFISVRSKRGIAQKIVKSSIRSSISPKRLGICQACSYGYRSVTYRAAEKYKVPLILWGESQAEATQDMEKKAFEALSLKEKSRFAKLLNPNYYEAKLFLWLQRAEFHVPGNNIFCITGRPILKNNNIREVRVFDYILWDREKIKETIMRELGWEKSYGQVSSWRTDCMLHSLVNYVYFKQFGCTKDCFGYCNMINSGQMDREEALKQEEEITANITKNIPELLEDKIGLSRNEATKVFGISK